MGGVGCDNMTVILTCFLHGGTYAELAEKCARVTVQGEEGFLSADSFLNTQHVPSTSQSKETVDTHHHHGEDPLDLRSGVAKKGIMLGELHPPHIDSCNSSNTHRTNSLKESCTV